MRRILPSKGAWTKPAFAYCEAVTATPWSPNHIRKITSAGLKTGGGADTDALCGRALGWDLRLVPEDDDVMALAETVINGRSLVCSACAQRMVDIEAA